MFDTDYFPETNFSNGFAQLWRNDAHWFINKKGNKVFGKTWKDAYLGFYQGIAFVSDTQFYNFYPIDTNGNQIGDQYFTRFQVIEKLKDYYLPPVKVDTNLIPFKRDSLWGFKDNKGVVIIKPMFYKVGDFEKGICPVRTYFFPAEFQGGYFDAIIDTKGKILNKAEMFCYMGFQGELIEYYLGPHFSGGPHYINGKGELIVPHK